MTESTQHKLDRVRPPRVQITYDVEIGDAIVMKELPMVCGILADLSGMPEAPPPKIKDRKLVEIDRDNFNEVMAAIGPRLVFQVDNRLTDEEGKLNIELNFNHIDDFDPVRVVNRVRPLRKLYEARQRLSDLTTKLDGNDDLDQLIQDVVASTESLEELKTLAGEETSDAPEAPAETAEPAEVEADVAEADVAETDDAPADEAPEDEEPADTDETEE